MTLYRFLKKQQQQQKKDIFDFNSYGPVNKITVGHVVKVYVVSYTLLKDY